MNRVRVLSLVWVMSLCAVSPLRAQTFLGDHVRLPELTAEAEQVVQKPAGPPPTPRHTGIKALFKDLVDDVKHLPSKENLFWAGFGGGLALAVHPADDNMNQSLTLLVARKAALDVRTRNSVLVRREQLVYDSLGTRRVVPVRVFEVQVRSALDDRPGHATGVSSLHTRTRLIESTRRRA